jgi:hypothetical protein
MERTAGRFRWEVLCEDGAWLKMRHIISCSAGVMGRTLLPVVVDVMEKMTVGGRLKISVCTQCTVVVVGIEGGLLVVGAFAVL